MTFMQATRTGIGRTYSAGVCLWRGVPVRRLPRVQQRCQSTVGSLITKASPHLPRILQPALWETVIPSTFRTKTKQLFSNRDKKPTNPATYFIWIYILIGSQAIRIIQTKNEYQTFSRKANLQIDKLREVVRKLQAGEEVDVEKALGTGIPEEEEAWEEAIREIEREERLWTENRRKRKEAEEKTLQAAEEDERQRQDASPVSQSAEPVKTMEVDTSSSSSSPPFKTPGFY